jgi:ribonuclease T2
MIRFLPPAFVAVLLTTVMATAQDQRQDTPGQFDFYVLSLSWSPSFCAAAAERGRVERQMYSVVFGLIRS